MIVYLKAIIIVVVCTLVIKFMRGGIKCIMNFLRLALCGMRFNVRRKKRQPDTRPRWNDELKIIYQDKEYTADEWQKMCARAIESDMTPDWKDDKTYNLRKNK